MKNISQLYYDYTYEGKVEDYEDLADTYNHYEDYEKLIEYVLNDK